MDNDLWSLRGKRGTLETIEALINDNERRLDLGIPSNFLWSRRSEILKDILAIQLANYQK